MHWRTKRKLYYTSIALLPLFILAGFLYYTIVFPSPTCSDGIQNGDETGVDCGGSCKKICQKNLASVQVDWSQSFLVSDDIYNAAAYIENPNASLEATSVPYRFRLYDNDGLLITERRGEMLIPPQPVTIAFEPGIQTNGRSVARTEFSFVEEPFWEESNRGDVRLPSANKTLLGATSSAPKLTFDVRNESIIDYNNVKLAAVIYDQENRPVHVSQTKIERLPAQSTETNVLTWRRSFPTQDKSCSTPANISLLIDRSGSMNDKSQSPPQPITAVREAAMTFIDLLDQSSFAGLVSFATEASNDQGLTSNHKKTRRAVNQIYITPEEETGFTNIGAAVKLAREQLSASSNQSNRRDVMIILTDGKANFPEDPGGEIYARQQVNQAKRSGITVYTIGLGDQVNKSFLFSIASSPDHYLQAADRTLLEDVYKEIHADICKQVPSITEIIPTQYELEN